MVVDKAGWRKSQSRTHAKGYGGEAHELLNGASGSPHTWRWQTGHGDGLRCERVRLKTQGKIEDLYKNSCPSWHSLSPPKWRVDDAWNLPLGQTRNYFLRNCVKCVERIKAVSVSWGPRGGSFAVWHFEGDLNNFDPWSLPLVMASPSDTELLGGLPITSFIKVNGWPRIPKHLRRVWISQEIEWGKQKSWLQRKQRWLGNRKGRVTHLPPQAFTCSLDVLDSQSGLAEGPLS